MKAKELKKILEDLPEEYQDLEIHVHADHGQSVEPAYFHGIEYLEDLGESVSMIDIEERTYDIRDLTQIFVISS